jgi:serine/threonine-protein kinase/endoribonuclease IRE1
MLEENTSGIIGHDWHSHLDRVLIDNLGEFHKYDGKSVQRALHNKDAFITLPEFPIDDFLLY